MKVFIFFTFCLYLNLLMAEEKKTVVAPAKTASESNGKKELSEQEEIMKNFKETKFLQVDQLDLPEELKKIEEQLRQNLVDVIILSKTHTPVYAQKREDGYTDQYKKFHSANLIISKIPNVEDYYALKISYKNWTTNKFDKSITKRISKYNVLNESRFAMFELLLGREVVQKHRDVLELENFKRIQAVRQSIEEQKKIDRRERLKKQEQEEEKKFLEEESKKKNKLKREEKEKIQKLNSQKKDDEDTDNNLSKNDTNDSDVDPSKNELEAIKATSETNKMRRKKRETTKETKESSKEESSLAASNQETEPPNKDKFYEFKNTIYAYSSLFNQATNSEALKVLTTTNVRYLSIGSKIVGIQEREYPIGYQIEFQAGVAIKKQNYKFPVLRQIDGDFFISELIPSLSLMAGIEYSPLFFVSLPGFGETLQVFENDFFWGKFGGSLKHTFFNKNFELTGAFYKSLAMKSNLSRSLDGTKLSVGLGFGFDSKKSVYVSFQKLYLTGDVDNDSSSMALNFYYKFEN